MDRAVRGIDRESIQVQRMVVTALGLGAALVALVSLAVTSIASTDPALLRITWALVAFHGMVVTVCFAARRVSSLRMRQLDAETSDLTLREPRWSTWLTRLLSLAAAVVGVQLLRGEVARWPDQAAAWLERLPDAWLITTPWLIGGAVWLAVAGGGFALLAVYIHHAPARALPEGPAVARWLRLACWFDAIAAVTLALKAAEAPFATSAVGATLSAAVVGFAVEAFLRLWGRSSAPEDEPSPRLAQRMADGTLPRLLGSRLHLIGSFFGGLAELFGIDLKGAWTLSFIRRSLLPIALAVVFVGWLTTSLAMVDVHEVGVLERFGAPEQTADGSVRTYAPGLHIVAPWPIDRMRTVSTGRVRETTIGYRGAVEGANLLWTATHATREHHLLLGDGRELIAINALLKYRVNDAAQYLYGNQQPDETLALLTDRLLLQNTVGRSLDDVLSDNLVKFGDEIEVALRDAAEARVLGIDVIDFTLVGLHPPVDVAPAYQAVVGARIEQQTRILEAEQYREEAMPRVKAEALRLEQEARVHEAERMSLARGESDAFDALRTSYVLSPELFRFRHRLEALERHLKGKPFHIIDHRIERDGGTLWILE